MNQINKLNSITLKYIKQSHNKLESNLKFISKNSFKNIKNLLKKISYKLNFLIWKIFLTNINNYKQKYNIKKEKIFLYEIFVNKSKILKKKFARAKGKIDIIKKRTSHITLSITTILTYIILRFIQLLII